MKSIIRRIERLEGSSLGTEPPVFVSSLDELNVNKVYSVIFCESEDISRADEFTYETLFYGGIYDD